MYRDTVSRELRGDKWIEDFAETHTIERREGPRRRTVVARCGARYRVEPLNPLATRFRGREGTLVAIDDAFSPWRGELLQDKPRRRIRVELFNLVAI